MQKESIAWLIIRILGLIFLGFFAFKAFYFFMNVISIIAYEPPLTPLYGTIRLPILHWELLIESVFSLLLSIYFIKFGYLAHFFLIKEGDKK